MRLGRRAGVLAGLLAALGPAPSPAQSPDAAPPPPSISIITTGPGALIYEKFGHNMIRVTDPAAGTDLAYNFGIFDFAQEHFVWNFLQGRMLYAVDAWDPDRALAFYERMGRSIEIQELALSPEQARTLADALARNVLPGNRDYRYDYYRDNCSTRVRDAINAALGGALEHQLSHHPTASTYRSRTAELTTDRPLEYFGLMLLLGPATDVRLNAWEESFVPMDLARYLDEVQISGPGDGGAPLVAGRSFEPATGARAVPLPAPAALDRWFQVVGLLLLFGLVWAGRRSGAGRGRTPFLLLGALWTLLSGLAGFVMIYLWAFTDHVVAYRNENMLQANILGLVLFGLFSAWARKGGEPPRALLPVAVLVMLMSMAGAVLKVIPGPVQVNGVVLAVFLPANIGLALAARSAQARRATTPGPNAGLP